MEDASAQPPRGGEVFEHAAAYWKERTRYEVAEKAGDVDIDDSVLGEACGRYCNAVEALAKLAPRDMREAAEMLAIAVDVWDQVEFEKQDDVIMAPFHVMRRVRDAMKEWIERDPPLPGSP